MIYRPDPKALIYSELNFISTKDSLKQQSAVSIDSIFDDVAQDIFNSYVAPTVVKTPVRTMETVSVSEAVEVLS
jgi:hypothetical protein